MNRHAFRNIVRAISCTVVLVSGVRPMLAQTVTSGTGGKVNPTVYRWDSVYAPSGLAIPAYDAETTVYREHIEVMLPPTYILVQRPKPPVNGYYGWKFTFGRNSLLTLVFRPDTALSATSDSDVLRESSLFLCRNREQWILSCTTPVRAKARRGGGGIIVDISDTAIVARVIGAKPSVLLRELFEPGGRFRVDETGIKYQVGAGR